MASTLIDCKALRAVNESLFEDYKAFLLGAENCKRGDDGSGAESKHDDGSGVESKHDDGSGAKSKHNDVTSAESKRGDGSGPESKHGGTESASKTPPGGGSGTSTDAVRRMKNVAPHVMHGALVQDSWQAPLLVTYCAKEARPGYNSMKAHEYNDDADTLRAKVKVLAALVRKAKHCVAYTGAGISTASGINDYASQAKDSMATGSRAKRAVKKRSGLDAEPTFAHYALTAMFQAGLLKHWVQQNHDGLPQKAGYPQQHLNEIHGAWFDPSNPVVPMTGTLRSDLCTWMEEEEEATDLVLAMGTSLCGMNADRMVDTPNDKMARGDALGAVIVGLQRTKLDDGCALRFFAKIDDVMLLLALELGINVPIKRFSLSVPATARVAGTSHTFMVPYTAKGRRATQLRPWVLEVGTKVKVTAGPGKGFVGRVETVSDGRSAYVISLPIQREGHPKHGTGRHLYAMGPWWVQAAVQGLVPTLPVVPVHAKA